ncbi:MAG: 2Fe-2S iron-sulfur cluster-binding protein [Pseudomonadota bacterium]
MGHAAFLENQPPKSELASLAWSGLRKFRVTGIKEESEIIRSFWLTPEDGGKLPLFRAGQYVPVRSIPPEGGRPLTRTYSLSAAPGDHRFIRISVKRESGAFNGELPGGVFSNFLHDTITLGSSLSIGAPRGSFVLDAANSDPVCLLSAGVGITPVQSMLEHLVFRDDRRPIWFIHGNRNGKLHAFRDEVRKFVIDRPWITSRVCYSRPTRSDTRLQSFDQIGRVDHALIDSLNMPEDTQYFLCGPLGFLRDFYHGLRRRGIDAARIHYEHFGTAIDLAIEASQESKPIRPPKTRDASPATDATVTFAHSGVVVQWDDSNESILELAESAGISAMYSCRSGVCQTCSCHLQEGEVEYFNEPAADPEPGEVLICSARPKGNIVLDL